MTRLIRFASIPALLLTSVVLAAVAQPATAAAAAPDAAPRPGPAAARLAKTVTVDYRDASLDDVLTDLQKKLGGEFRLDKAKFAARKYRPSVPISLALRDVPASRLLALALRFAHPFDPPVAVYADGNAVVATPVQDAPVRTTTAAYAPGRRLPAADDGSAQLDLARLLMQVIEPASWRENGGAVGTIEVDPKGNLLVTATADVQANVRWVLATLSAPPGPMTIADTPAYKQAAARLAKPLAAVRPAALPAGPAAVPAGPGTAPARPRTAPAVRPTTAPATRPAAAANGFGAAVDRVRQGANVNVVVNRYRIASVVGVDATTPVTLPDKGSAADVMAEVVKQVSHEPGARIVFDVDPDGVVVVTTADDPSPILVLGVYDVRAAAGPGGAAAVAEQVMKRATPNDWRVNGGRGGDVASYGTAIVVSATRATHAEVAAVLNAMAKARR